MEFVSKRIDLTLRLTNEETKETKEFRPNGPANARFAESIMEESRVYLRAQRTLPEVEQETKLMGQLKFLSWVYKDLDTAWILDNFSSGEVDDIADGVRKELLGLK